VDEASDAEEAGDGSSLMNYLNVFQCVFIQVQMLL